MMGPYPPLISKNKYRLVLGRSTNNQLGFGPVIAVLVLSIILIALVFSLLVLHQRTSFRSLAENRLPSADACNAMLDWEHSFNGDLLKNYDFDGIYTNGVPSEWSSFVEQGNVKFVEETGYEKFGRASFRIDGNGTFSAGIYQKINGLTPGAWYHAFYATAQKVFGANGNVDGALPITREIGVDTSGGSDPSVVTNWGIRRSGGQQDKLANKYGGWKTMANQNNPVVTFQAVSPTATIFIKVSTDDPAAGSSNTWIESAYLGPDCNSNQTIPNTPSNSDSQPLNNNPVQDVSCSPDKVDLVVEGEKTIGEQVTLNLTSANNSEGTTFIDDEFAGLDCSPAASNRGVDIPNSWNNTSGDWSPTVWPKVNKYWTCTVEKTPFTWTHNWKVCADNNCSLTSNQCSKSYNSETGMQTSPNTNTRPPSTVPNPAEKLKTDFGLEFRDFSKDQLQWAYQVLASTQDTKFPVLTKAAQNPVIIPSQDNANWTNMIDCSAPIQIAISQTETQFKFSLLHELGHRIYACTDSVKNLYAAHDNAYNLEGAVSVYSYCAPPGSPPTWSKLEDFAETVAYFLQPNLPQQKTTSEVPWCNTAGQKFADNQNPLKNPNTFPQHYQLDVQLFNQ